MLFGFENFQTVWRPATPHGLVVAAVHVTSLPSTIVPPLVIMVIFGAMLFGKSVPRSTFCPGALRLIWFSATAGNDLLKMSNGPKIVKFGPMMGFPVTDTDRPMLSVTLPFTWLVAVSIA